MACRIIEGGGSDLHVQSVLGHADIRQSAEYRKEADRRPLAKEAMHMIGKNGMENT
jgi:integrase